MVKKVLEDALTRFVALATASGLGQVEFAGLEVCAFRQTWPDASCGFGGIAAQVLTDAQTVVVSWTDGDVATVYIRGEFAYLVNSRARRSGTRSPSMTFLAPPRRTTPQPLKR